MPTGLKLISSPSACAFNKPAVRITANTATNALRRRFLLEVSSFKWASTLAWWDKSWWVGEFPSRTRSAILRASLNFVVFDTAAFVALCISATSRLAIVLMAPSAGWVLATSVLSSASAVSNVVVGMFGWIIKILIVLFFLVYVKRI